MSFDWRALMRLALKEARRGHGNTGPNPLVGAVLARDGVVVAKGYHARVGGPHAEVEAFAALGERGPTRDLDLVVTLEPCSNFGRTPPCVDEIVRRGVKRVVVGCLDPNPRERGRGVALLRDRGLEVILGVEEERCRRINEAYFKYITTGLPFVTLKLACSLDGRIATRTGDARWVSGEVSLRRVHAMRRDANAVLVGAGTAVHDDPKLTVRLARPRTRPLRAVVSSDLQLSESLELFKDQEAHPTVVFTTARRDAAAQARLEKLGVRVVVVDGTGQGVDLRQVVARLGEMGVSRVLVEGGARLAGALVREALVDRLALFFAPMLLGESGLASLAFDGNEVLAGIPRYSVEHVERSGNDVMVNVRLSREYWRESI